MRTRKEIWGTINTDYPADSAHRQATALAILAETMLDIRDLLALHAPEVKDEA